MSGPGGVLGREGRGTSATVGIREEGLGSFGGGRSGSRTVELFGAGDDSGWAGPGDLAGDGHGGGGVGYDSDGCGSSDVHGGTGAGPTLLALQDDGTFCGCDGVVPRRGGHADDGSRGDGPKVLCWP
jgi:hypothetical protein